MLVILIRTIVLYTLVLLVMRAMGKREIGQLQPFELVISIMIADLASIPMSDIGVPIYDYTVPHTGYCGFYRVDWAAGRFYCLYYRLFKCI